MTALSDTDSGASFKIQKFVCIATKSQYGQTQQEPPIFRAKDSLTFALFVLHSHHTGDHRSEITAMNGIALTEAESDHKLVQDVGCIFASPLCL